MREQARRCASSIWKWRSTRQSGASGRHAAAGRPLGPRRSGPPPGAQSEAGPSPRRDASARPRPTRPAAPGAARAEGADQLHRSGQRHHESGQRPALRAKLPRAGRPRSAEPALRRRASNDKEQLPPTFAAVATNAPVISRWPKCSSTPASSAKRPCAPSRRIHKAGPPACACSPLSAALVNDDLFPAVTTI